MAQLQTVANNFVTLSQGIGVAMLAAMIALIALLIFTSFGSEHKMAIARAAALGLVLGFALLMAAPTISTVVQRFFPVVQP